jgi:hypothetical protein
MARKRIPKAVEHAVREECGQACANPECREWNTATHEIHHIDGDSGNSVLENLILLCGSCHNRAEAASISESEIRQWKRMASYRALPPVKGAQSSESVQVNVGTNQGLAAGKVTIGKLVINQKKSGGKRGFIPGTIGADADMKTYADYLVKRYIDWRKKGQMFDRRPFSPRSAHGILAEGFGSPSSVMDIPQERFFLWVAQAQQKIDRTVWGKNNKHRNYHSWEEHLAQRHG